MKIRTILCFVVASMIPAAGCASPSPGGSAAAASPGRILIEYNLFLELHSELIYAARTGSSPFLDPKSYAEEIAAYARAGEQVKDFKTWQLVYDACAEALEVGDIKAASEKIPSRLEPSDREEAKRIFGALLSAWTRFESKEISVRRRGLMVFTTQIMRRLLTGERQDRILATLYEKMSFKPLDAAITVFMVTDAPDVGAWGRTSQGYYLVIPVQNRQGPEVSDALIHEVIHLLDRNQPPAGVSVLARLKAKADGADPKSVDTLSHGLVAWTSGFLIRKHVKPDYVPLAESLPAWKQQLAEYLPAYQGDWAKYLEGTGDLGAALTSLTATLKPKAAAVR